VVAAAITEYAIAIIMMTMVLFTSNHHLLKKYTRVIAGCFVCLNVIFAGPVSGFGMNPARSFASAFPAHIYTAFWIYMLIPFAGMLSAAEIFLFVERRKASFKRNIILPKANHFKRKKYCAMKKLVTIAVLLFSISSFGQVTEVGAVGITVKDMNTSVKFYTEVLGFKKISDKEFTGADYENLENVFGLNMRVARLQLGNEQIELTDYLTSAGRSIPEDAKANDLFFQHIAIVVSDMDKAFAQLKKSNVEFLSSAPQTLPKTIPPAEGVKAFYFHDPDKHNLELIYFPRGERAS
jgi:catechol 2,3-dioxygenase-like lactoylglutathione lyase family enzyme